LPPNFINPNNGQCEEHNYTLTLTSDKPNIEPSGTTAGDGNSSATLTITVIDQSTKQGPTKPVQVKLVAHKPTDGGHDHDDPSRPRGGLNGMECTTDDPCVTLSFNGGVATQTVNFKAPIVSGKHSFSATCDKCGNSPQTANLEVKVEGLKPIPASTFYALTEPTGDVIGARSGWHTANHYLMPDAAAILWRIAVSYNVEQAFKLRDPITKKLLRDAQNKPVSAPVLHLNDASLPWGGVYDICARPTACIQGVVRWDPDHYEHRRGSVVDVRANSDTTAIPVANFVKLERLAARYGARAKLESSGTNRHYHLRLFNRKE